MRFTIIAVLALASCTDAQLASVDQVEARAAKAGALFCAKAGGPEGALTIMLANAAGAPVKAIGQSSDDVARGCALVNAIPVVPPANPDKVPVVASKTTLPPV